VRILKFCFCNISRAPESAFLSSSITDMTMKWDCPDTTWHFHFSLPHLSRSHGPNPRPLRLGLSESCRLHFRERPLPSFHRMSWNWIPGFSQREEQMVSPNGYERTRGYISSSRKTFSPSLFHSGLCLLARHFACMSPVHSESRVISKKKRFMSFYPPTQIRLTFVIKFFTFHVFCRPIMLTLITTPTSCLW